MKLTKQQAEVAIMHARALCATHPYVRFGQSLWRLLPVKMTETMWNTDKDFFYWSNKEIDSENSTFFVGAFANCREQGFSVGHYATKKQVCFSEYRSYDSIVVYAGDSSDFDYRSNMPLESSLVWHNSKHFSCEEYDQAADFILEHILGGN